MLYCNTLLSFSPISGNLSYFSLYLSFSCQFPLPYFVWCIIAYFKFLAHLMSTCSIAAIYCLMYYFLLLNFSSLKIYKPHHQLPLILFSSLHISSFFSLSFHHCPLVCTHTSFPDSFLDKDLKLCSADLVSFLSASFLQCTSFPCCWLFLLFCCKFFGKFSLLYTEWWFSVLLWNPFIFLCLTHSGLRFLYLIAYSKVLY